MCGVLSMTFGCRVRLGQLLVVLEGRRVLRASCEVGSLDERLGVEARFLLRYSTTVAAPSLSILL